jgi:hypothetical protein
MSTTDQQEVDDRPRRRSSKTKRTLHVDTKNSTTDDSLTPRTAASTPSPPVVLRNTADMRSPGQRKSPLAKVASDDANGPIPDFITQTDRFGNASTPRSQAALEAARGSEEKQDHVDDIDACAETLMDSFRIMCCCLISDEPVPATAEKRSLSDPEETAVHDDRPRLLPEIHPNDRGKKCLVLDLDETLVHSSFRAVPGADFVIPVQVRVFQVTFGLVYCLKAPWFGCHSPFLYCRVFKISD